MMSFACFVIFVVGVVLPQLINRPTNRRRYLCKFSVLVLVLVFLFANFVIIIL